MIINKADKPASGFLRHVAFHYHRGKGHLLKYAWNRVRWHVYPRLRQAGDYPDHVDLELSSSCNMVCPMCYTVTPEFKREVPHVNMDYTLFRRIVDELGQHGVYSIRLSWRGEPLLNAHFTDCVRYAKKAGICEVSALSNGLRLTEAIFEELVDLEMDWLTLSFDGTGETYERIRKPAVYTDMVARIAKFSEIKKAKGKKKPVVRLQGVWPAVKEDPDRFFRTFTPIVDEVSVNSLLDYLHEDREIELLPGFTCPVPFQRLAIGSDGRAFMCVNDELGRVMVGDARTQSIGEIWNGAEMRRVRSIHERGAGAKELVPCQTCYQPRKTERVTHAAGERLITLDELVGRSRKTVP